MKASIGRLWTLVMMFWLGAASASAACTGASPTWNSTPDSASITTCVNSASTTGLQTIYVSAGSATWTSAPNLPSSKSIALIGAGIGQTNITLNTTFQIFCGAGKPHRVSGFTFSGSTSVALGVVGSCAGFRIDHNKLQGFPDSTDAILVDEFQQGTGNLTGLIDNNQFTGTNNFRVLLNIGENSDNWPASPVGTANTVYFEDNVIDFTAMTNASAGCVDANYSGHFVWRFNRTRNCLVTAHGVCNATGTISTEIYNNDFTANSSEGTWTAGQRLIHHQGSGEMYVFGNRFTASGGKAPSAISLTHYRSAPAGASGCGTPRCDGTQPIDGNSGTQGYPCFHQPGRNGAGQLTPIYIVNNLWSDNGQAVWLGLENPWGATNPSVETHVQPDRDYYDSASGVQTSATAPFSGTTGAGWGTLARRPTTCRAGVGYWVTDQGEWNSRNAGADGQLFKCVSTNTWAPLYTPYTYPHPLQGAATAPPPPPPPTAPATISNQIRSTTLP